MVLLLLTALGCDRSIWPIDPFIKWPVQREQTVLALGDSYTIGQSVPAAENWPQQLVSAMRARQFSVANPVVIARTGWTTGNLIQAISGAQLTPPYDIVTLLIGVNDQYQGRGLESYRQGFNWLLAKAIELAGNDPARVIVISIPDYSVTPFAQNFDPLVIRSQLDKFNALNLQLALAAGVHYVDITPGSRQAAQDRSLLAADQLHPSGKMYAEWVRQILPVAAAIAATPRI